MLKLPVESDDGQDEYPLPPLGLPANQTENHDDAPLELGIKIKWVGSIFSTSVPSKLCLVGDFSNLSTFSSKSV